MGGFAWVTLATNDSYSLGAIVLGHSLKISNTAHQLIVLVTPGVSDAMKQKLGAVFNIVEEVNILDSKDDVNLKLLRRPELGVTFTKLHCWRLTQFEKCVFLDADTMVLQNCDELFEREELSGAPDVGWPDCFNSGVFVYRPSNETYENIVKFALENGSFDGGDQGLLNKYFSDWAHKDISKHLPFIYNMACTTALYSYLPAFKEFGLNAKIIHFISGSKPWLQYFNTETKKVYTPTGMHHLNNFLQTWWDIFCNLVHPILSTDMGGIAGAFAQLTLGAPRTAEQSALDDHLRRQGWEVGNIDYLGKDSFDNIWNKICQTLSDPPQKPEEAAVTSPECVPKEESVASKQEVSTEPKTETCAVPPAEASRCDISCTKDPSPKTDKPVVSESQTTDTQSTVTPPKEAEIASKPTEETKEVTDSSSPVGQAVPNSTSTASKPDETAPIVPKPEAIPDNSTITEPPSDSTSVPKPEPQSDSSTPAPTAAPASDSTSTPTSAPVSETAPVSQTEAVAQNPISDVPKSETSVPDDSTSVPKPESAAESPKSEPVPDSCSIAKPDSQCSIEKTIPVFECSSTPTTVAEVPPQATEIRAVAAEIPPQSPAETPAVVPEAATGPQSEVPLQPQVPATETLAPQAAEVPSPTTPASEQICELLSLKPEEVPEVLKPAEAKKSPEKPSGLPPKEAQKSSSASSPVSREQSVDEQNVPTPPPRKASGGGGGGSNKKGHKSKK